MYKYITAFDYIDKNLIVLYATSGGIPIVSSANFIGVPAEIARRSFTLLFSWTTGIIKKVLKITTTTKKKHNKVVILDKNKLNNIETLMS